MRHSWTEVFPLSLFSSIHISYQTHSHRDDEETNNEVACTACCTNYCALCLLANINPDEHFNGEEATCVKYRAVITAAPESKERTLLGELARMHEFDGLDAQILAIILQYGSE